MKYISFFLFCSVLLAIASCSTADLLWKYRTEGAVMSGPATGAGGFVESTPVIADGILYVGSNDKCVYAIKIR